MIQLFLTIFLYANSANAEYDEFSEPENTNDSYHAVEKGSQAIIINDRMISIIGIIVAVVVALVTWYMTKKDLSKVVAATHDDKDGSSNKSEEVESESEYLRKLVESQSQDEILNGKTDTYEWKQTEREIDISFHVPADLKRTSVKLEVSNRQLLIAINGKEIVKGQFYAEIVGEDSNWQFEGSGEDRRLEFTAPKKVPTQRNQHWRSAIKGEGEIGISP